MRKIRKYRGRKTGHGHKKKQRGAGNRGGRGVCGLMKHKRSLDTKNQTPKDYHLKPKSQKVPVINLSQLNIIAEKEGSKTIDVSNCKVLGKGNLSKPLTIKALTFSRKAVEKITKAGGKAEGFKVKTETETETEPEQPQENVSGGHSTKSAS